jgi:predicted MFS family arabinose efflux permease
VSLPRLMRDRRFAVPFLAEVQSLIGDQLARVALSVLVFQRTGSVSATAATYAATFLPALAGGWFMARLGDRSPRATMVGCDVLRAAAFLAMAVPGVPLGAVVGLLVTAVYIGPAFGAAEVSYLASALDPERFRAANGFRMIANQAAQVGGFAVGGVVVAAIGTRPTLAIDGATYLVSVILIGFGLVPGLRKSRSADRADAARVTRPSPGIALLWRRVQLRGVLGLVVLAGCFVVPEGLAVPLGAAIGANVTQIGVLLAAIPLGGAVGALVVLRIPRVHRRSSANAMAIACGLPLLASAAEPAWPVVAVCWFVSGALASYQVELITELVRLLPERSRSRLMGVVSSLLLGAQGVGLLAFGLLARVTGAGWGVFASGATGSLLAAGVVLALGRRGVGSTVGPAGQAGGGAASRPVVDPPRSGRPTSERVQASEQPVTGPAAA